MTCRDRLTHSEPLRNCSARMGRKRWWSTGLSTTSSAHLPPCGNGMSTAGAWSPACPTRWTPRRPPPGAVMRPSLLRRYALEAGFSDVEILPIVTDYWRFYQLIPERTHPVAVRAGKVADGDLDIVSWRLRSQRLVAPYAASEPRLSGGCWPSRRRTESGGLGGGLAHPGRAQADSNVAARRRRCAGGRTCCASRALRAGRGHWLAAGPDRSAGAAGHRPAAAQRPWARRARD